MLTGFLLLWPLLAAVLLFAFAPKGARIIALSASLVELAAALYAACTIVPDATTQFVIDLPWIASLGIRFAAGMDGISVLLVLLTCGIMPFIILSTFRGGERPPVFYSLMLIMQMALVGVFTALDGFLFYLFWEVALIPVYFICLIWGGQNRARVTLKFFIYTLAGSLLMLAGLIYLYTQTAGGSFGIGELYAAGRALPEFEQGLVFWAFFIAFAIKMPVFPLHTWQPDTYTEAPVQGTMLLSAIMLKMGIYGVIRWLLPVVPLGVEVWGHTAIVLSVTGILYASFIAFVQNDLKRLIAYASIAHIGLISGGIFTLDQLGLQGAMIQMLSHGLIAFTLFYLVDILEQRMRTRQISDLGGIRAVAPVYSAVFLIVLLGSIALPMTSGFIGEFLLISSLARYELLAGILAGATTILGAAYMLIAYKKAMLGDANSLTSVFSDLTAQEKTILIPMVLLIIGIGVFPAPLMQLSEAATAQLLTLFSDLPSDLN